MNENPIYSDFWLDHERYSSYIDPKSGNTDEVFLIDLIQLASVRRVISNYVDILTGTSVPVYFKAIGDSYNIGGKEIYISTAISRKKDFDQAVGLALHEAAHTLLTDFDQAVTIPFKAPKFIWDFGRKHNIPKLSMERFLKTMFNIVEDWYIDDWVISRVPGYVGYYEASYNVCFNTPDIDSLLLSKNYRHPSLSSYEFRIINFCNPLTDLQALPGLEQVAKEIDISNISRLQTTQDRIEIAYKVVKIVLENLETHHSQPPVQSPKKVLAIDAFFKGSGKSGKDSSTEPDVDQTVKDVANTLAQRPKIDYNENPGMTSQVSSSPNKELDKELLKQVEKQVQYVHGHVDKQELNSNQKTMLDLIERHGIKLVYVPVIQGNEAAIKVTCIVVKKMTMELIESGPTVFPMANFWKDMEGTIQPDKDTAEAVKKGVQLGTKLGKRLIIRREVNKSREIRKSHGKINRRLLYSAGFDAEDIFERIQIHKYNKGSLHITIDASNSMRGTKWNETMTMCVAICKATSMVDNIHVTVSFRATKTSGGQEMPYIVQAYDSSIDKFSKVQKLFRYLMPAGCTPEGLAFGAIMKMFTEAVPDEVDRYFLNISDGEPYFSMKSVVSGETFHYGDGNGVEHTRAQISKIRRQGINVLSYYVQDDQAGLFGCGHDTRKNFQLMYGNDARFIKNDDVASLAKTINELFLRE